MKLFGKKNQVVLVGLLFTFLLFPVMLSASDSMDASLINCDIQQQYCTRQVSGGSVTLDIGPDKYEGVPATPVPEDAILVTDFTVGR